MLQPIKINRTLFLTFFFLIIYLLLPTNNSDIDAYNYAANLRWNHDLFFPHHLLYNAFDKLLLSIIKLFGFTPDILAFMKVTNALFAFSCLLVFEKILSKLKLDKASIFALVLFAGSCFGFMRYATESETYIIPLFWSLLASLFYLKYYHRRLTQHLLFSGLFASIAFLFHQIHIWWYIGLVLGTLFYHKSFKETLLLIVPSFIIPLIYYWAFKQTHFEIDQAQNLWQFIFYDYYYGTARVQFGIDNLVLGFINFIRSFIQVHGNIWLLLKKSFFYLLILVPFVVLFFLSTKNLFKTRPKIKPLSIFLKTHLIIFIFHFAFAIFSEGNAEFMVMLPFLFLVIISSIFTIHYKVYLNLGFALLLWNFTFGIFPNNHYDFQNQQMTIKTIKEKPDANYILSESTLVQNILYYENGTTWHNNIYKSPGLLNIHGQSTKSLKTVVDSLLSINKTVYTDCIDEPVVMNRKNYFLSNENETFFGQYGQIKIDSTENIIGTKYLYQLTMK